MQDDQAISGNSAVPVKSMQHRLEKTVRKMDFYMNRDEQSSRVLNNIVSSPR